MTVNAANKPRKPRCLRGFEHVNRYWDKHRKMYVAKILPGEFYVSREDKGITTVLGSCVSACIWDEVNAIGGMNHFMLPITVKESHAVTWGNATSDATRYGNYAMEHLINEILKNGGERHNLKAKVFGGGKIIANMSDVGEKNSAFVLDYLQIEKIPILAQDLSRDYPRKVFFDPTNGKAFMKRITPIHNETIFSREEQYKDHIAHDSVDGDIELF
ncbi:chemoreceptor glutamine deamidase CheD [Oceanicoccus sagamiensis]|uniref:Probable chemoreceptor glutamine deamidase CheD n=1 Tax=Oceanicoccus sagamiensis TaxID=716816 RepID=A0A1X9NHJ4_9GAMM|nr:chemoreceptor glutamine deamidase CheD [Oceanicoccus sagamiensis]ARN74979.1 chemotaxis protein CheD [Oceanicoccus sagamiensis]